MFVVVFFGGGCCCCCGRGRGCGGERGERREERGESEKRFRLKGDGGLGLNLFVINLRFVWAQNRAQNKAQK